MKLHNLNALLYASIISFSLTLVACGGGGGDTASVPTEPVKITASSWKKSHKKTPKKPSISSNIRTQSAKVVFETTITKVTKDEHWQIHIDADNNPATGYQFDDVAWAKQSGIDYLIEDGYIFKSTANDSSWSWKLMNKEPLPYTYYSNFFRLQTTPKIFEGLCKQYNIGFTSLDDNWQIETFLPKANSLLKIKTKYCNTPNEYPVITLKGDKKIFLELGKAYVELGASATDKEDGDLTANIKITGHVSTQQAGVYKIKYSVSDSLGFVKTEWRTVIVKPNNNKITVDGSTADWSFIPLFATRNGNDIKITDDKNNIYVLVTGHDLGSNTQLYIDSDRNPLTGYAFDNKTGTDFMVENESLSRYAGAKYQWAWDYNIANIPLFYNGKILEMAIPKASLTNLVNKPTFIFASLNKNWGINFALPEAAKTYVLKYPVISVNKPPVANNDKATTTRFLSKIIDVLHNDSDPDHDKLVITKVTQPSKGTVKIVNNKIVFKPIKSYIGSTSFTYTISDGHKHAKTASVARFNHAGTNHAPTAVVDAPSTYHKKPIKIYVLKNDTDPDGDALHVTTYTQPKFGTAKLNSDGSITFDPQGHVGSHAFDYTISDGFGGTDTTTVTIATTDPNDHKHSNWPVIRGEIVTTFKNKAVFIKVLANDTDADGDKLILDQVDSGGHGTTLKINGGVLYTPIAGYTGTDQFYYGVHDGYGHNGTGKVSITVRP